LSTLPYCMNSYLGKKDNEDDLNNEIFMTVHLIKSSEVSKDLFTKVMDLLKAISGPMIFNCNPDAVIDFGMDELHDNIIHDARGFGNKRESNFELYHKKNEAFPLLRPTTSMKILFEKCDSYRIENAIPADEFVFLLTDIPNSRNVFSSLDQGKPVNGFIHTADWKHFISCAEEFPVAYEVIALIIRKHMFEKLSDMDSVLHVIAKGCMNDFCENKRDIILKLRTADICRSCIERLEGKMILPLMHHALNLLESFRVKMLYSQSFRQHSGLSELKIDNRKRIYLSDFGNVEIKLRPLEKALYFLFLKHPDGIYLSSLYEHRQELYQIYSSISNLGFLQEMLGRIDELVNALGDSASQKISRIKRVFEDAVGSDLARHYYIHGPVGYPKKIHLERKHVCNE
jgi:hypothetical protein